MPDDAATQTQNMQRVGWVGDERFAFGEEKAYGKSDFYKESSKPLERSVLPVGLIGGCRGTLGLRWRGSLSGA